MTIPSTWSLYIPGLSHHLKAHVGWGTKEFHSFIQKRADIFQPKTSFIFCPNKTTFVLIFHVPLVAKHNPMPSFHFLYTSTFLPTSQWSPNLDLRTSLQLDTPRPFGLFHLLTCKPPFTWGKPSFARERRSSRWTWPNLTWVQSSLPVQIQWSRNVTSRYPMLRKRFSAQKIVHEWCSLSAISLQTTCAQQPTHFSQSMLEMDKQSRFNHNATLKWRIKGSLLMTGMSLSPSSSQIGIGCWWSSFMTQMKTSVPGSLGSSMLTSSSSTKTTSRSFHIGTLAFLIAGWHDFAHRLSSVDQVYHLEDVLPNINKTFSLGSPYCWCLASSTWASL